MTLRLLLSSAAGAKPDEHRSVVRTPQVDSGGGRRANYTQAVNAAKSLVSEGWCH